jgi:hypothetical protein
VKLPSEFGQVMIMGDPLISVPKPLCGDQQGYNEALGGRES